MNWDDLYIGIYACIIFQLAVLASINLLQKRNQNSVLGIFCVLFILSIIKIAFWNPIQGTFFFLLFGGPHELLLPPLLYTYLLAIEGKSLKVATSHIISPVMIYVFAHPVRILFFGADEDHFGIVIYYTTLVLIFTSIYLYKGLGLIRNELSKKLKSYPKLRFSLFYLSVNFYLLTKILIVSPLAINYKIGNPFLASLNNELIFPVYIFLYRYLFILPCIAFVYYVLTEVYWVKKYFLNASIYSESYTTPKLEIDIEHLAIKKESFRDNSLVIKDFLKIHGIKKTDLRTFLYKKGYSNFTDFVNTLRVKDFKERLNLPENKHYDLFSIAKESGFKSKATFYRVFKNFEGITPNEYKKEMPSL